jgi:hypothetical protein
MIPSLAGKFLVSREEAVFDEPVDDASTDDASTKGDRLRKAGKLLEAANSECNACEGRCADADGILLLSEFL